MSQTPTGGPTEVISELGTTYDYGYTNVPANVSVTPWLRPWSPAEPPAVTCDAFVYRNGAQVQGQAVTITSAQPFLLPMAAPVKWEVKMTCTYANNTKPVWVTLTSETPPPVVAAAVAPAPAVPAAPPSAKPAPPVVARPVAKLVVNVPVPAAPPPPAAPVQVVAQPAPSPTPSETPVVSPAAVDPAQVDVLLRHPMPMLTPSASPTKVATRAVGGGVKASGSHLVWWIVVGVCGLLLVAFVGYKLVS